jgi:RNA polymerase sigma factor (sigma-70 family)
VAELRGVHLSDLYLAGAAATGHPAAWRLIEEQFGPRVIHAIRTRRRISEQRSEEVWSDTRTRLMEPVEGLTGSGLPISRIGHYRGTTPLFCYVLAAASNRMNDRLRKDHVRQAQPLPELSGGVADRQSPSPSLCALDHEARHGLREGLFVAFDRLTPRQKRILAMVFGDGRINQQDAAAALKTSPATVSREIQRAAATLRRTLAERGVGAEPRCDGRSLGDELGDCLRDWLRGAGWDRRGSPRPVHAA